MGVVNLSSHSFFHACPDKNSAVRLAFDLIDQGADILDLGVEATNPAVKNLASPSSEQQLAAFLPVIHEIVSKHQVWVSIDTSDPCVMRACIEAGAHIINDQRALSVPGALACVADLQVPVCLMHFFQPIRIPGSTSLDALFLATYQALQERIVQCQRAGIAKEQIIIDPGFGGGYYGKNTEENFYLLRHLERFLDLQCPILVGLSRKKFLGSVLGGVPVGGRKSASTAASVLAVSQGARIVRVHDVKETKDAMAVFHAWSESSSNS